MTPTGRILSNLPNTALILEHDPRTRDTIAHNDFLGRAVIRADLKVGVPAAPVYRCDDRVSGTPLQDCHAIAIRAMLESQNGPDKVGYGVRSVSERDLHGAIQIVARRNLFHPIREYLDAVRPVPGFRAEQLFIRYCGCPDRPYYREAGRLFMLGAVAQAYEPGHKFDFAPILYGGQGKRKSTFTKVVAKGWAGELKADFKDEKRLVEQMRNHWLIEMPELSSIRHSQIEEVKAFLSATSLRWLRLSEQRLGCC